MSKVKSNNYEKAIQEVKELDEKLIGKIPNEIDEKDAGHFNVALVRIIDKPGQPKNDVKITTHFYDVLKLEKIEKSLPYSGYSKMIIVHDPTKQSAKDESPKKEIEPSKGDAVTGTGKEVGDKVDFGKTIAEMKAFAETNGVDLTGLTKSDEIKAALNAWVEDNKNKGQE